MASYISIVAAIPDETTVSNDVPMVEIANYFACLVNLDTLPGNTFSVLLYDSTGKQYRGCRGDAPSEIASELAKIMSGNYPQAIINAYGLPSCVETSTKLLVDTQPNPTDGAKHFHDCCNAWGLSTTDPNDPDMTGM